MINNFMLFKKQGARWPLAAYVIQYTTEGIIVDTKAYLPYILVRPPA